MKTPLLVVRDLHVTYEQWGTKVEALRGTTFELFSGEWVTLSGPNGSGKSTLLRAISGELDAESGSIELSKGSGVYTVKQNPIAGTSGSLTVLENLWLIDSDAPRNRRLAAEKYHSLLSNCGLQSKVENRVDELSGGQRQILAVSMAALTRHTLVLLDEPTAALDEENTQRCLSVMANLVKAGRSLLQVSHDRNETLLSHRTLYMDRGTLISEQVAKNTADVHMT